MEKDTLSYLSLHAPYLVKIFYCVSTLQAADYSQLRKQLIIC